MVKKGLHINVLRSPVRIKSVSLKLSISVLVTVMCIVALISSISFYSFKNTYEQKVAETSAQTMGIAGKNLTQMLDSFVKIAQSLENNQDFTNRATFYLGTEHDSFEENSLNSQIQSMLETFLNVNPSIRSISIIPDETHSLITTADTQTILPLFLDEDRTKVNDNEWYKEIQSQDGNVVWLHPQDDPFVTLYQKEQIYAMGKLLKSPLSRKPLGTLVLELSTVGLAESLDGIRIGPSGANLIVDSDMNVIYGENDALVGSRYQGIFPKIQPSEEVIQTGSFSDGSDLYVYSYLAQSAWFLLSYAPKSELLADMRQMQNFIQWVALILAACSAVLIGYIVRRNIGKPLSRINAIMELGEQGNLGARTNTRRVDQIGDLERSFDRMMDHITLLVQQTSRSADAVIQTAEGLINSSRITSSTSHDISAAISQITHGAVQVAEDAETCNDLTIRNNERIKLVKASNEMLEKLGHHLKEASHEGQFHMSSMLDRTEEVEGRTKHLIERVTQLKEGTGNIEKIVQLLSGISKQTAILSLNASIEASKAGAAGKGFMVIAEEIRRLSDQSKESLHTAGEALSLIIQDTGNTVASLADLHPTLSLQTESIHQSKQIFERLNQEVTDLMAQLTTVQVSVNQLEESQGSLSSAIESVSSISEETSAASEEVLALSHNQMAVSGELTQLSEDLNKLAGELHHSLNRFKF